MDEPRVCSPKGKAVHDLPAASWALRLHELRGLLIDIFSRFDVYSLSLLRMGDALKGAFQGNVQQIVVDGFGDEIGRFQLEPLNRHFQIRMSGNEDDFGFRREDLDVLQEIQPFMPGILMSVITMGMGRSAKSCRASSPEATVMTLYPASRSERPMTVRMPCSSSTRRMVSFMSPP